MTEDHGRGHPPRSSVSEAGVQKEARTEDHCRGLAFLVPLVPLNSGGVQCVTRRKLGGTVTSQEPVLSSGPCPVCAQHSPLSVPRG